jgi:hypothetical protein
VEAAAALRELGILNTRARSPPRIRHSWKRWLLSSSRSRRQRLCYACMQQTPCIETCITTCITKYPGKTGVCCVTGETLHRNLHNNPTWGRVCWRNFDHAPPILRANPYYNAALLCAWGWAVRLKTADRGRLREQAALRRSCKAEATIFSPSRN